MSSQSNIAPGPIAPFNNPPIEPQYFQPRQFEITAITLGTTTLVTTSVAHDYAVGQQVRLYIPSFYGCQGLSGRQGYVIALTADTMQMILNIDSSQNITAFIPNPSYGPTPPQVMAIGDVNTGAINSDGPSEITTYIPGSFINISPN